MWGRDQGKKKKKRGRGMDKEEILVNAAFPNILVRILSHLKTL